MEITKHSHATVVLAKDDTSLVIDPGAYTPNSADLVDLADAVLVTHDHPDHFDAGILDAALAARPALRVWAPDSVVSALDASDGRVTAVAAGDRFTVGGFDVEVVGRQHAPIHRDVPVETNVGYLVDGSIYHPGDAYVAPGHAVDLLLLPSSGPWVTLAEAVDFVRDVQPARILQIHDLMASDVGRQAFGQYVVGLTGIEVETVEPGAAITV